MNVIKCLYKIARMLEASYPKRWVIKPDTYYEAYKNNRHTFIFKSGPSDGGELHIFARHLKYPKNAMTVYFDPKTTKVFNEKFKRWEMNNGIYEILVKPSPKPLDVFIISCYDSNDKAAVYRSEYNYE